MKIATCGLFDYLLIEVITYRILVVCLWRILVHQIRFSLRKIAKFHIIFWCGSFVKILRLTRNSAEIVCFHKIPTPLNWVKLRYYMQSLRIL